MAEVKKLEFPQVILTLEPNKTRVEVNDAALSVPASRMERAFREIHKTIHLKRLEKSRASKAKVQSTN